MTGRRTISDILVTTYRRVSEDLRARPEIVPLASIPGYGPVNLIIDRNEPIVILDVLRSG